MYNVYFSTFLKPQRWWVPKSCSKCFSQEFQRIIDLCETLDFTWRNAWITSNPALSLLLTYYSGHPHGQLTSGQCRALLGPAFQWLCVSGLLWSFLVCSWPNWGLRIDSKRQKVPPTSNPDNFIALVTINCHERMGKDSLKAERKEKELTCSMYKSQFLTVNVFIMRHK